ncbi:MAG: hypothetical protein HY558_02250 [Euryarchaeota archaeon]|nr:hypothetical protein [Euryarchaeota archaeon]
MLVLLLVLLAIAGLYLAARRWLKMSLLGEAIIGLLVGIGWEYMTRDFWTYHYPLIEWESVAGVPVGIAFGWAFFIMVASLLSRLAGLRGLPRVFADMVIMLGVGGGQEYLFCCVVNFWSYTVTLPFLHRIVGWSLGGLMILAFVHTYREDFERAALSLLGRRDGGKPGAEK